MILSILAFMSPSYASPLNLIQSFGEPDLFNPRYVATDNLGNTYVQSQPISIHHEYIYNLDKIDKNGSLLKSFPTLGGRITVSKDANYIYEVTSKDSNKLILRKYNQAGTVANSIEINNLILSAGQPDIELDTNNQLYIGANKQIFIYNSDLVFIKKITQYQDASSGITKGFEAIDQLAINEKNQLLILDKDPASTDDKFRFILIDSQGKLLKPISLIKNISNINGIGLDKFGYMYAIGSVFINSNYQVMIKKFKPNGNLSKLIDPIIYCVDLALDSSQNLILSSPDRHLIQKIDNSGITSVLYGAAPGKLAGVDDFALDANRNLYILDSGHQRVQKVSADGSSITANWGNPALTGGFSQILVAPDENVYLQYNGGEIKIFTTDGLFLKDYEQLWPSFDKSGNVFQIKRTKVSETIYNYFIEKLDNHGLITKSINYPKTIDSTIDIAPCNLNSPLALDNQGNLYSAACHTEWLPGHSSTYINDIYLLKINIKDSSIVQSKLISHEFNHASISLTMDSNNTLYLGVRDYYDNLSIFVLDQNLTKIGELRDDFDISLKIDSDNNLHFLNATKNQVNKYSPISRLKAPSPIALKQLNDRGVALLTWEDRTTDETGFKVYRCKDSFYVNDTATYQDCQFKLVATTAANVTKLRLPRPNDLNNNDSHYKYKITAIRGQEESIPDGLIDIYLDIP